MSSRRLGLRIDSVLLQSPLWLLVAHPVWWQGSHNKHQVTNRKELIFAKPQLTTATETIGKARKRQNPRGAASP